jgi:hypothetical protein
MPLATGEASFVSVAAFLPLATALHIAEEWPGFPRSARRLASPRHTDREYLVTHTATLKSVPALLAALVLARALHTLEVGHNVFKRW